VEQTQYVTHLVRDHAFHLEPPRTRALKFNCLIKKRNLSLF
jgi:hypothetical protein